MRLRGIESLGSDQGDEPAGPDGLLAQVAVLPDERREQVRRAGRDRDDQAAVRAELCEQAVRRLGGRGVDRDRVVGGAPRGTRGCRRRRSPRRSRCRAPRASRRAASPSSGTRSMLITCRAKLRQNGGGVAGAGADLEHVLVAVQLERLADRRHHPGLGDGLVVADRQRRVVVGARRVSGSGTKCSRGTAAIAASTRSSPMPRRRSWRSTIRERCRRTRALATARRCRRRGARARSP